jgi:hypothetical protein
MPSYKHSGTFGDLVYSMCLAQHFGRGKFYLHLDQINWIGKHFYGSTPAAYHQGRMTEEDFEYMKDFMLAQPYIEDFQILTKDTEITHNLDRFRNIFVGHPGNYIQCYAWSYNIMDTEQIKQLETTPWLTATSKRIDGREFVVNRTERWLPNEQPINWQRWQAADMDSHAVFIGLESEYDAFVKSTGWKNCIYHPTKNLLEWAELINGADTFIGNQSVGLSLAVGLGKHYFCELRSDLPLERNECYFPNIKVGKYF